MRVVAAEFIVETAKAKRDLADLDRSVDMSAAGFSKAAGGMGSALGVVGAGAAALAAAATVATAALARMAVDGFLELARRGQEIAPIRNGFVAMSGSILQADAALTTLRASTRGLIPDIDLMQSANKAMLLGVTKSGEELGSLAETATVLGRAMGQTATKSFNDLIVALGRSSPLILDNLGLTVKVGEANEAYARSLGKTADELTAVEKRLAFKTAALEAARVKVAELGGVTLTVADYYSAIRNRVQNFTDALAVQVAQSPVITAGLQAISARIETAFGANQQQNVSRVTEFINRMAIGVVAGAQALVTMGEYGLRAFAYLTAGSAEGLAGVMTLVTGIMRARAATAEFAASIPGATQGMKDGAASAREAATQWQIWTERAGRAAIEARATAEGQGTLNKAFGVATDALGEMRKAMVSALSAQSAAVTSSRLVGAQVADTTEAVRAHNAEVRQLSLSYTIGWETALSKTMDATRIIKREFVDLQDEVAAALAPLPRKVEPIMADLSDEIETRGMMAGDAFGFRFGEAISRAFQGGGSVSKSIGAFLGGEGLTRLVEGPLKGIASAAGGILGSVLPGLGNLLGGLGGGAIGSLFGKLFKTEGKQVNDMRDQFISAAGGLAALNEKAAEAGMTLDRLLAAKKVEDFHAAVDALNLGFVEQEKSLSRLEGLLQKYGLTWQDVGQKAKQANLDQIAMGLESDMRDLLHAGVDQNLVLEKMASHYSELARIARDAGTQIPQSLASTFQMLDEMGLLLDANGARIENVSDLFASWPAAAQQAAGGVERALDGITPPTIRIPVEYDYKEPMAASMGGLVGRDGLQYLAKGGRVLPFSPRGTDTVPAMLTPGEVVIDVPTVQRNGGARQVMAKLRNGSFGPSQTFNIAVQASTPTEGRAAAAAFDRELRRRGIRIAG